MKHSFPLWVIVWAAVGIVAANPARALTGDSGDAQDVEPWQHDDPLPQEPSDYSYSGDRFNFSMSRNADQSSMSRNADQSSMSRNADQSSGSRNADQSSGSRNADQSSGTNDGQAGSTAPPPKHRPGFFRRMINGIFGG